MSTEALGRTAYSSLGARRKEVLLGPGVGLDNAVVSVGERVMILTTDPISMVPMIGPKMSAWLSVQVIASDFCTSGASPQYASFVFNFPPGATGKEREAYLVGIGSACKELNVSIVAGHTGSYPGSTFTVIGSGTMFGLAERENFVDPSMAKPGDALVMTKGAGIEATAYLANSFPNYVRGAIGEELYARAKGLLPQCTTVSDAIVASSVGLRGKGVTSMHDATEGGVLGALCEMASASGHSILVDKAQILIEPEVEATCSAFGIDPLVSLSEGTLLITVNPAKLASLLENLDRKGIAAQRIGEVREGRGLILRSEKSEGHFKPGPDPYWRAYTNAVVRKLT